MDWYKFINSHTKAESEAAVVNWERRYDRLNQLPITEDRIIYLKEKIAFRASHLSSLLTGKWC